MTLQQTFNLILMGEHADLPYQAMTWYPQKVSISWKSWNWISLPVSLIHWLMMHGTFLHWVLHCAFLKSFFGTPNGQTMGGQKNYVVLDLHVANQIRFRKSTKYVLVIKIYQKRLLDN